MRNRLTTCLLVFLLPAVVWAERVKPDEPVMGSPLTTVSVLDLEALLSAASGPQLRKLFSDPEQVKRVAQQLYVNQVLAHEAREMGIADAPLVQAVIAQKSAEYLAGRRLAALDAEPLPSLDAAAHERYLADPERYSTPTRVRVAHILVRTRNRVEQVRSEDEARELADSLRARVLAGESFEELAVEYSDDPSAKSNKGDLGFFGRGKMVKSFEDAAFALQEPGEISGVVESAFGFHVLKLIEREDGELKPFEEVEAGILAELESELRKTRRIDHVERIKAETGAVLYEDIFDAYVAEKRALMDIGSAAADRVSSE